MSHLIGSIGRWHGESPVEHDAERRVRQKQIAEHEARIEELAKDQASIRRALRQERAALARLKELP